MWRLFKWRFPVSAPYQSRIEVTQGCWNWLASTTPAGYGMTWDWSKGKGTYAHRIIWQLFYGRIPKGLFICHTCDNPSRVNPSHLFLATNAENMRDASTKGRLTGRCHKLGTHCRRGHELSPDNILYDNGYRRCKICRHAIDRRTYARHKL